MCFQGLAGELCRYLQQAQYHIRAAVCWFSHREIFEVLLARLQAGVQVELILEYDTRNIGPHGLDFQNFIHRGGKLFGHVAPGLMHHKFAIIDDRQVLTGSFNWTYNSNWENLLVLKEPAIAGAFHAEFERIQAVSKRIFQVRSSDAKVFADFPLFENTRFPLADLRKKVSGRAEVWTVPVNPRKMVAEDFFRQQMLPFDPKNLMQSYWSAYIKWDTPCFEEAFKQWEKQSVSKSILRDLRCRAIQMKIGDLVFLIEKRSNCLLAIGVIQSEPQPNQGEGFSSFRAVQWLKTLPDGAYRLPAKVSMQVTGRYRASALQVLQEVIGV